MKILGMPWWMVALGGLFWMKQRQAAEQARLAAGELKRTQYRDEAGLPS